MAEERLRTVLDALERAPEASPEAYPTVIEEMTAVDRPLTPEDVARLHESRRRYAESLSEERCLAPHRGRAAAFAGRAGEERERLVAARRAMLSRSG